VTEIVELAVEHLGVEEGGRWRLRDVSFEVHRGEVVGIAGVEGNGQHELIEAVMGIRPITQGTVRLAGTDITSWSTRARREAGIGYVPEDRQRLGLMLPAPLWENVMLGHQTRPPCARGPWIDVEGAHREAAEVLATYDVMAPSADVAAFSLSGGNQQKLVVGREMMADPRFLVAAHPTRGIDVGAQAAVWEQLRKARAAGLGVLLLSADLDELIGLSDTLYVILRGRLVARVDPATVTPQDLGAYMTGAREAAA
jgi:simple sugar transport system ATP-binding protein